MSPLQPIICPSMLSSDFAALASEARRMVIDCGADWLHMDVMDGHFVPNLTLGPPIVKCLRQHTDAFLDCHCMVSDPARWIDPLADAGASLMTFHPEALGDLAASGAIVRRIRAAGMKAGVAIKPGTPLDDALKRFLVENIASIDVVLVMTVEPGFGGQRFMPAMMAKVAELRALFPALIVQVDGGLSLDTIEQAADAGANCIVAGSAIFNAADPARYIASLRAAVAGALQRQA